MNTYLLEIGLEEMPAQMILPAVEQLKSLANKTCELHKLSFDNIQTFSVRTLQTGLSLNERS